MTFSVNDIYNLDLSCSQCSAPIDVCACKQRDQRIVRKMFRGDALIFDVQVQRSPFPDASPIPLDITGYFMWSTAKRFFNDPDTQAVAQVTITPSSVPIGGGIIFTAPTVGKAEITLPPGMTYLMPDGVVKIVYDVKVRDTVGRPFTVEAGVIVVYPNVTLSM